MRILGKRASEFSNQTLSHMIRDKRVYYHGKWFRLSPEMVTECVKVMVHREKRTMESLSRYAISNNVGIWNYIVR